VAADRSPVRWSCAPPNAPGRTRTSDLRFRNPGEKLLSSHLQMPRASRAPPARLSVERAGCARWVASQRELWTAPPGTTVRTRGSPSRAVGWRSRKPLTADSSFEGSNPSPPLFQAFRRQTRFRQGKGLAQHSVRERYAECIGSLAGSCAAPSSAPRRAARRSISQDAPTGGFKRRTGGGRKLVALVDADGQEDGVSRRTHGQVAWQRSGLQG
jgi:hypothetical protein